MTNHESREDDDRNSLINLLQSTAARLGEHFNSVRIIATREAGRDTELFTSGSGNLYAQHGSVTEWIEKEREQARLEKRDEWGED